MATNSVTSSTSGATFDVPSLVSQLMSVERQPITRLNTKQTSYQSKITALGLVKSKVAALQTAAQNLGSSSSSSLNSLKATPSDSTIFSATASSSAITGTYSLSVGSLAQSQKLVAVGQVSSTAAIGTGAATTITFDFGSIDISASNSHGGGSLSGGVYTNADFNSNGSGTHSVVIDSSNNTLQGIRDAINAASIGVTASIVNDGSGTPYRLALSSDSSGLSNSIKITTDGADASIDSLLAYNPAGTQNLSETVSAKNAALTVNGIAISKSSNTITDAIQGVTLSLSSLTTTPATLTITRDTTAVSDAVNNFVAAYNDLYTTMKTDSSYQTSGTALAGDSTLRSLQSQMRSIASTAVSSGTLTNLFDVGLSFKTDGTLQLDSSKLSSAMAVNFNNVASLFNSTTGFATRFDQWSSAAIAPAGTLSVKTNGITKSISDITNQIAALEVRMTSLEKMYTTQYSQLNATLLGMSQTSTYLTQQFAAMNAQK